MSSVAVIGAGIAGLAAAYELTLADRALDVTVYEASDRAGGKIRTTPFAGLPVDEGADAFLARVPWARELCEELGLDAEFTSPANGHAYVYSRGALRRLPPTNLLGVPLDLDELEASGIVPAAAVERARLDLGRESAAPLPAGGADISIGALIRARLGDEINERLVDPLIGGIYAGDTDQLSLHASAPQFLEAARRSPSLIAGLASVRDEALTANSGRPVFYGLRSGTQRLCDELRTRLGSRVELSAPIDAINRIGSRYELRSRGAARHADSIIVATPAYAAAALLRSAAPPAAERLHAIDYASVVLVTMAVPRHTIEHPLDASGFLVPKCEGRFITACSWASTKWAHLAPSDLAILRVSAGHVGDHSAVALDDITVVERMLHDIRTAMGPVGDPIKVRITRWKQSFPQYRPGHIELVSSIDQMLADSVPRVVVTGAAYGGIGIPATVRHARDSAQRLLSTM